MTPTERYNKATLGGPGLEGYTYKAAVYCVPCAEGLIAKILAENVGEIDTDSLDELPQPVFFPEHEEEQGCDRCGRYLYGGHHA